RTIFVHGVPPDNRVIDSEVAAAAIALPIPVTRGFGPLRPAELGWPGGQFACRRSSALGLGNGSGFSRLLRLVALRFGAGGCLYHEPKLKRQAPYWQGRPCSATRKMQCSNPARISVADALFHGRLPCCGLIWLFRKSQSMAGQRCACGSSAGILHSISSLMDPAPSRAGGRATQLECLRRLNKPSINRPMPSMPSVPGSGTTVVASLNNVKVASTVAP